MAAVMMAGVLMTGVPVHAEDTAETAVSVYDIDRNDPDPMDTLKEKALEEYAEEEDLTMEDIDVDASSLTSSSIDWTKSGLQNVTLQLSVVEKSDDGTSTPRTLAVSENAEVNLTSTDEKPQLILKSDSVTIDLNSTFNYADNIGVVSDGNNQLPVLAESDNVDVTQEGTYEVTVEATNSHGTSTVSYEVVVKKPAEVVRAEEEAAKAAAEEVARKAAEEAAAAEAAAEAQAQAEAEAAAQAAAAETAAATTTASTAATVTGDTGSAIADYALSFVGCSYVYGGSSPSGFDCSGFTMYVYAQFGISLPHSANAQAGYGTLVSAEEAQPGDLVTYNGHAAIYIGNSMIVNALNPAYGVCVCNMYSLTNGNMQIHRL